MIEDIRVVCDQCGSWQIKHRRKYALPIRRVSLSDWIREPKNINAMPAPLQAVDMVAECQSCHFTVEYISLEIS
jgi:hypothetical protein